MKKCAPSTKTRKHVLRRAVQAAAVAIAVLGALTGNCMATDVARVGKAQGVIWAFLPVDVGIKYGIFEKYGIVANISNLGGDAKVQQALAADSIDFGLGGGPALAFAAKGVPAIAVAALAGAPRDICIYVAADSPIRSLSDLKGKKVGVSTEGSLTDWMGMRVSLAEGWGRDGMRRIALGAVEARLAALRVHQIDADIGGPEVALQLEEKHVARILATMDQIVPDFITHAVFARKEFVAKNPVFIRRFLSGLFASIAFMKSHKTETDAVAESVLGESPTVADKVYDYEIPMLNDNGTFDPKAIGVLKQSFLEMGILDKAPEDSQIFTTEFVPVKP